MSMLLFMPWCPLDKTYRVGEMELVPYQRSNSRPIAGLDSQMRSNVDRIIGMYKTIEGNPVARAAVIHFVEKSPVSVLDDDEIAIVEELVTIACFAALSKRQYFGVPDVYCNSDCFLFHIQRFKDTEFFAFSSRRRAGRITDMGWSPSEISITVPMNCHNIDWVTLDERLLGGLLEQRAGDNQWGRWQNALSCFNQANTDSSTVQHQVEWMLICSACEHLLGAKSQAKDVASKFSDVMQPDDSLPASKANRRSDRWRQSGGPLRYEWMREFYSVRGDFAHGQLKTRQPIAWNPLEHLLLATIAFPLVVKSLLQRGKHYDLSDADKAQIDVFERFADTSDFLRRPPNQKGSGDTHWGRLYRKRYGEIVRSKDTERIAKLLEAEFPGFFGDDAEREADDPEGM